MREKKSIGNHQWPSSVAIIGAGTMGLGVAECFSAAGIKVRFAELTPKLAQEACDRLVQRVHAHVNAGLLPAEVVDLAAEAEAASDIPEAVDRTDLVFEAVPEQFDLKREVLAAVANAAPENAIIASNTSSLPIDDLALVVNCPERFLGMHWFNPPEWTPGVEIIPAKTDPQVVNQVVEFLRRIGKRPVVVANGPGFVANRIQMALFRESLACVEDGLASPQEVDEVVRSCFGFRLPFFGPFQIADMAGLDVYASIFETLESGLGEAFRQPEALSELVEQGCMGTKSGTGFFTYSDDELEKLLLERDQRYAALGDLLTQLPPLESASDNSAL